MAHCCFKSGCELEVQYACLCLSSTTYSCELHLKEHLKLPKRTHTFDSILAEPSEGTKDIILEYLAKEKSKKHKLKKIVKEIALTSVNVCKNLKISVKKSLRKLNFDLKEIRGIIKKISQLSDKEEDKISNKLIIPLDNGTERAEAMLSDDSGLDSWISLFGRPCQLKNKLPDILKSSNNNIEIEQDFREACLLYKNIFGSLFNQNYKKYISDYQKISSLYSIVKQGLNANLYIYNTETEREELKVLPNSNKSDSFEHPIQLPNGELVFISRQIASVPFIIDRNYKIRRLPYWFHFSTYAAVYYNRCVYCFGEKYSRKFYLDENRCSELARFPKKITLNMNCVIFNRNILISIPDSGYIWLYSIDIESFSKIPNEFVHGINILINYEKRLYVIELNGWIYESEDENEYVWKQIANSMLKSNFNQVYWTYNKGGIYISTLDHDNCRNYFKFDLKQKILIEDAFYGKHLALKRSSDKFKVIKCYGHTFKLRSKDAVAYFEKGYSLYDLGKELDYIEDCNENIKCHYLGAWRHKGNKLIALGKDLEAIECYNEEIKLNPSDHDAYENKGNTLMNLGRNLEAIECYSEAIKLIPGFSGLIILLEKLFII